MQTNPRPVDVLAVGAHPDDVELGCAGTLAKMIASGVSVGILDLTAGEMGTRGDKETRLRESHKAAEILGATFRACFFMPDTRVEKNETDEKRLVGLIRTVRPRILLAPVGQDTHPDHCAAALLVDSAWYKAGFGKYDCPQKPFRPERLVRYMLGQDLPPSFVVDISAHIDQRHAAVMAYESQFFHDRSAQFEGKTRLATPQFQDLLDTRLKYYGSRILKAYGEPFLIKELTEIDHPARLSDERSIFKD
ncbi:MAG: bacillithiol biosynthesis deacetylase BshB1 [Fibrobacterota bacterium]